MEKTEAFDPESYQTLLVEYASGTLDEAHALVVATHISLSRNGREQVTRYEHLGGALLSGCCKPEPMKQDAFAHLMERVEEEEKCARAHHEKAQKDCADKNAMPGCLESYVQKCGKHVWKAKGEGIEILAMPTRCNHSCARLMRLAPKTNLELRARFFRQTVLVLEGTLTDGKRLFGRGDLAVLDSGAHVIFAADPDDGSLCLLVCRAPKLSDWLRRLFAG